MLAVAMTPEVLQHAPIADASARVLPALEVDRTAQELVNVTVSELADVAAVGVLDAVLGRSGADTGMTPGAVK
ncbi:hypothetical protein [Streptomyces abikoensis]|uniref:hypothetical protein n=1 Tax=Streptomyces abikoensis TaxID=97398 RepID=UPI0036C37F92